MPQVTFEEVYADAYVRESINVLIANLINQYPVLRPEEDDIRQILLDFLNRRLPRFDHEKSSLHSFVRRTLEFGVLEIKRIYFSKVAFKRNAILHFSVSIDDDYIANFIDSSVERRETIEAVRHAVTLLPPNQRKICAMLADGETLVDICRNLRIGFTTLKYKLIPDIRRVLAENIF